MMFYYQGRQRTRTETSRQTCLEHILHGQKRNTGDMSSFWSVASTTQISQHIILPDQTHETPGERTSDFLRFLAVCFGEQRYRTRGLHPVLTNASPSFSDVSAGGTSFDIRKVRVSSFPHGLDDAAFKGGKFVVVKQPRSGQRQKLQINPFHEVVQELQILREERIDQHPNIIKLIGVVYHDTSDQPGTPDIVPALVVEYAALGDLRSYLADGIEYTVQAGYDICLSIASGLQCLHGCGIIHCDIKDTNILVCLDEKQKPIAKISDFGFAISQGEENPRLIGYTHHWEAPEVHMPLVKRMLPQIDIYSYGLLFYTIMKRGTLFYEALPTIYNDDTLKMKTSNVLHELLQLNLLIHMKSEHCLLLCFCKVIRYCLQADSKQRFESMKEVVSLLELCNPSKLVPEEHLGEGMYQKLYFDISYYKVTTEGILEAFASTFESYTKSWSGQPHLGQTFLDAIKARFFAEFDMLQQRPPSNDVEGYWCSPYLDHCIFTSMLGLLPIKQNLAIFDADINGMTRFAENPELDLQAYDPIARKLHSSVKNFLFTELKASALHSHDQTQQAEAFYNLAYCHIEGIGTNQDVSNGLEALTRAAKLGSTKAQDHLIQINTANRRLTSIQTPEFLEWLPNVVQERNKRATEVLRLLDPEAASSFKQNWASERAVGLNDLWIHGLQDADDLLVSCCESWTWQAKLLHFASATGMIELVSKMINLNSNLLDAVNQYGQTPLIIACQNGHLQVVRILLEHNANAAVQDVHGFSALHWTISFADAEKEDLCVLLTDQTETVNAFGQIPLEKGKSMSPNLQGGPEVSGTSLHWAVACRDVSAVRLLLNLGANPLAKIDAEMINPLELACSLHAATIIEVMLDASNMPAAAAKQYHSIGGSELEVNLMFWVVAGVNTYQSLIRCGINYQQEVEDTIRVLVRAGTAVDSVLRHSSKQNMNMSAPFATSLHHCPAEIMKAGVKNGFSSYIDTTFGGFSSGGPAMSLAIAHNDREMFTALLDAGASINWRNRYGMSALGTVAKETDDTWFALQLLERGALINNPDDSLPPFFIATYTGNLSVAQLLWERGAKRDARDERGLTVLGSLIGMRTRNAGKFINFVLELPDRDESEGFIAFQATDGSNHRSSAFHLTLMSNDTDQTMAEDPDTIETSRLVTTMLIQKYSDSKYLNSKEGPHHDVALGMAVEVGNHPVVRILLEAGADPNAEDEYSRRPMDKLLWRYCYPATLDYIKESPLDDKRELRRRLSYVNQNTSEILSLLKSYGAESHIFRYPAWHESNPGYRELNWVIERLREDRERSPVPADTPTWGGLPITIPERPMQFTELERRRKIEEKSKAEGEQPRESDKGG